jgi:L-alanine-DL-glutamate epimerase-like enolase superfamily enzyme
LSAVEQATTRPVRIRAIETAIVSTFLSGEFRVSHGADTRQRDHVLVRIIDGDGVAGFGESSPLTFFTGETAESVRHAIDAYLAPLTVAQDATQLAALHRAWDRAFPGHGAAKCALDLALHDLLARRSERPVADLLGGIANAWLPLYKAIGFGSAEYVVAEAEGLWEIGIRRFKLKVGEGTRHDLAKLSALRERFGFEAEIVLDGNGGYAPQEAVRLLRHAEPFGVTYIEQPVPGDDLEGLAFVRANGGVPVMADESLHTLRDAHRLICMGAVDLFGIKLIKTGGLWPARQIAALAEACGVACVVISPFDTQLGIAAAAHLAATFPQPLHAQGLGTFLVASGEAQRQLRVVDGMLEVPAAAGFGVAPEAALFAV